MHWPNNGMSLLHLSRNSSFQLLLHMSYDNELSTALLLLLLQYEFCNKILLEHSDIACSNNIGCCQKKKVLGVA